MGTASDRYSAIGQQNTYVISTQLICLKHCYGRYGPARLQLWYGPARLRLRYCPAR